MERKASAHADPCNIAHSEAHNRRTKEYMANIHKEKIYVRTDLTSLNEEWVSDEMKKYSGLQEYYDMIKVMVKEKTGREMQEKPHERRNKKTGQVKIIQGSSPIKEDCVIIKEDSTMEEIFEYVRLCHEKWGLTALQIFIHRDEGHWEDPVAKTGWIPNPHAHVIWDWMDHETGKSWKLQNKDTSRMQDFAAQALGMERGKSKAETGAEHLNRNDYILAKQKSEMKANEATLEEQSAVIEEKEALMEQLNDEVAKKQSQVDSLEESRVKKARKLNEEKGSQILNRVGDIVGVGKNAEIRKENKQLQERNKALENENESLRKHDEEVQKKEEQIPQVVVAEVKKLLPQAVAKATAEKDKQITKLRTANINANEEIATLKNTVRFYQSWANELWEVLGTLAKAAMKALYDFAKRGCNWLTDTEEAAVRDYIGDDKNRRRYADDLKVYSRLLLPTETLSVIDYHIDDIHDKYAPNQDRSQGRGGISRG